MSTGWTYECRSHESGSIQAEDDINRGVKELMELLEAFRKGLVPREVWIGDNIEISVDIWGKTWPWRFLVTHKECKVRVVSEYGDIAWKDPATGNVVFTRTDGKVITP